ncbi:MAG TPA: BLUF domain-containing protein [Verrucomicrobiae bacterium]|nr:BLUF domain-containing protein [Verrucomicrobiae bacterium]
MALFQIVYVSTASEDFSRAALLSLLKESVGRNTRAGITGLLLYKDGCFMQALEGEEPAVISLFSKISRDPRHHHVIPLIHETIDQRYFPNSAMAFRDLGTAELNNLPGYSEFLNTPLNGDLLAADLPKCKRLLLLFKQNVR